jgi:hypothetical protein
MIANDPRILRLIYNIFKQALSLPIPSYAGMKYELETLASIHQTLHA